MTNRERENATLSFLKPKDRGSVEETFYPWGLTIENFIKEGFPTNIAPYQSNIAKTYNTQLSDTEKYLNVRWGDHIFNYEKYLGFDPVRRISFTLPFRKLDKPIVVNCDDDWNKLKEHAEIELKKYYTDENILKAYGHLTEAHQRGDYSVRMNIEGFFWVQRELLGIEPHMYVFYDNPGLLHDINEYVLKIYLEKLTKALDILPPDVLYIMEDLSGKNGPMISPDLFNEFVGSYYKRLLPVLKSKGVRHIFVDTDGDFSKLIPNFIEAGVEGFLPMDVNAGMDIVATRKKYPNLKFIGAYNKLCIAEGKNAIDVEIERILPVVRQGGFIPGCDHQLPPSASLENYKYFIQRLKEVMSECACDI